MSATPTGADAMKEAERLLERVVLAALSEGAHANPMGSRSYHDATVAAQTAMLAFIRKLVEAQPAAVAGEAGQIADEICREVAELPDRNSPEDWPDAMLVTHDELRAIVLDAIAAPAAPLVGEPKRCPHCDGTGDVHDLEGHWLGHCVCSAASPAAPAGVPTDLAEWERPTWENLRHSVALMLAGATDKPRVLWERTVDALAETGSLKHVRVLLKTGSVHPPACDSSEASGSAIPARPTLPGEVSLSELDALAKVYASSYASPHHITFTVEGLRALLKAAPVHPSSVQAVDGDEPVVYGPTADECATGNRLLDFLMRDRFKTSAWPREWSPVRDLLIEAQRLADPLRAVSMDKGYDN